MLCQMSSSAISSPAITPCTLTTSYFPVGRREGPSRPPALAYLQSNNCGIFRGGICGLTLKLVASGSIKRAAFGDMAMKWSEASSQRVGATWSAGSSFMPYPVADHCRSGAWRGLVVQPFTSMLADGLTLGDLFVGGTPSPGGLTAGLTASLYEQVQPLEAIAVAFNGGTAVGRPGWFGSVPCRGRCNAAFSSLPAAADSDGARRGRPQQCTLLFARERIRGDFRPAAAAVGVAASTRRLAVGKLTQCWRSFPSR